MARPVGGALAQHRILFGSVCAATLDGQPWPQVARATIRQLTTTDDGRRAGLRLYQGKTRAKRSGGHGGNSGRTERCKARGWRDDAKGGLCSAGGWAGGDSRAGGFRLRDWKII